MKARASVPFALIALALSLKTPAIAGAQQAPGGRTGFTHQYDSLIVPLARKAHVPVNLVKAIITVESQWDPTAVHLDGPDGKRGGSYGLMQVSLRTAREMGFRDKPYALCSPATNLAYGIRFLGWVYAGAGGNVARAVSVYNGGHVDEERTERNYYVGGGFVYSNEAYVDVVLYFYRRGE